MSNANLKFYEQLLQLHLFQGVGRGDLEKIVGHSRLGFETFDRGSEIAITGQAYTSMLFLTSGCAQVSTTSIEGCYTISETISAPYTILPERMFGLSQSFSRSFVALEKCCIMSLSKEEILKLTDNILIFRLNLLNTYTTMIQKREDALWSKQPQTLEKRIAKWMTERFATPTGEKSIRIKMNSLAQELNDSRLDISRALNNMQAKGLVALTRGNIYIQDAGQLLWSREESIHA